MSDWLIVVLVILAGLATGCLVAIYKAIERLSEGIFFVRTELTKMNSKLESVEVSNKDKVSTSKPYEPNPSLEAAIRDLENLKIDLDKPDH